MSGRFCLRKGTMVYHGTSVDEPFGGFVPDAPAWFTTSKAVAEHFAISWRKGPKPRVLIYRVNRDLCLTTARLGGVPLVIDVSTLPAQLPKGLRQMSKTHEEFARRMQYLCEKTPFDGYYDANVYYGDPYGNPDVFVTGDDIMLCSTSALEFVGQLDL